MLTYCLRAGRRVARAGRVRPRAIPHRARCAAGLGGGFCFRYFGNGTVGFSVKRLTMRQRALGLRFGFKGSDLGESASTPRIPIRATCLLVPLDFELKPAHVGFLGHTCSSRERAFVTSVDV